jgi:hypothetical protein
LNISTPPHPQLASRTPQSSAGNQPSESPSALQKPLSGSRTPEQLNISQPATTPDVPAQGPILTSRDSLGTSHPSESLTSAQAPSGSSQQPHSPSRRRKKRKGRGK